MNDLMHTYQQLSETHRKQLLAYADILLIQQKTRRHDNDLSSWKNRISQVSTWSDAEIEVIYENAKSLNQWKIPEW